MKATTGATPLASLDAVAIDTETTSLDTSVARVVEIGAWSLGGRSAAAFETLVDPGENIPARASAVHGISDAMVGGAPPFKEAWAAFTAFAKGRVLVGYSIGYDLAILERESARAGIAWTRPRSLCVRLLASLVNPNLPDFSLDMIAGWLGVAIEGRHRAAGDARAAAAVFRALLPKLQERGIRTLAEAERACLGQAGELETHERAGWNAPATLPSASANPAALRVVDPYAYEHRVGEIMSAPPIMAAGSAKLIEVVELMVERRISSVLVSASGAPGGPIGDYRIFTERDMMRRIAADGAAALQSRVGDFATGPLASVRTEAFVYRAIGRMDRLKIRHLAVRDEAGRLAGIVSARDLLKLRAGAAINLDDAIEEAETPDEMAAAWAMLPSVAEALIGEAIDARLIAGVVSEELAAMTRRAALLSEQSMLADGHGKPPCAYAVLVLGSGGRGESLLAADQDNAIVFAAGEPGGPKDNWFGELGRRLAETLAAAGIPLCKGGVMAKNPQWRGSLATWRARIGEWLSRSRPEDLLNVDIFFDLAPVHGDTALGQQLYDHAYDGATAHAAFAKLLGEQLGDLGTPFTLFGGLRHEEGRIDLKKFGLFPIVAAARTLAIRHDVRVRGTKQRLERLIELDIGGDADMRAMLEAHELILALMLAQQSRDLHSGIAVSNSIETARLGRERTTALKAALRRLQNVPALVGDMMFAGA